MRNRNISGSRSLRVQNTRNLDQFKTLPGNRSVNPAHAVELQNLILENGNLTGQFPIVVTKDMYVIDGQHRLAALRELGYDVSYIVQPHANIDTVRHINRGGRNWSWRDMAVSYADLGNTEYEWFLSFVNKFGLSYRCAMLIVGEAACGGRGMAASPFMAGELVINDRARAYEVAVLLHEVLQAAGADRFGEPFSQAVVGVIKSPQYDHKTMIRKLTRFGYQLPDRAVVLEYKRQLEKIFNKGVAEESKLRLF